ncbi:PP0621 family protein [Paucibacter sp. Y2R2-4]|uniref:PP0621 family protein n=1 Tax=Paucibacter sp. Y2R2-4 TaxID=2893553 RepID=UPI0021E3B956|nr:PP0621 family protein [Paucibacter sp. Y2R2-4]MCV2349848.1 hypothetical protein [Paucibacter sp. Y2R2-4]
MKYLLLIVLLALVFFILGVKRARSPLNKGQNKGQGKAEPAPQRMAVCEHCGVHLPREDALPGLGGDFCSLAHRKAFENSHPLVVAARAEAEAERRRKS